MDGDEPNGLIQEIRELNHVNVRDDNSMENSHTFLNPQLAGMNTRPHRDGENNRIVIPDEENEGDEYYSEGEGEEVEEEKEEEEEKKEENANDTQRQNNNIGAVPI